MTTRALLPVRHFLQVLLPFEVSIVKNRAHDLLEERLQKRRHGAEPQGINNYEMIRPADCILDVPDWIRKHCILPLLPGMKQRKIKLRGLNVFLLRVPPLVRLSHMLRQVHGHSDFHEHQGVPE